MQPESVINPFFKDKLNKLGFNELLFHSHAVFSFTVSIIDFIKIDYEVGKTSIKKILLDLFFFGRKIKLKQLEKFFFINEIEELIKNEIIEVIGKNVRSLVRIVFYKEYLFVCDFPFRYEIQGQIKFNNDKKLVFIPLFESYYFTNFIIKKSNRVLDVGTGSGFLAIIASKKSRKVIGVDINERALKYAKLNIEINGIKNVEFRKGDLFDPVKSEKFDLIFSNPPHGVNNYLIDKPIATDGGRDGLILTRRIIRESPPYLTKNGKIMTLISIGGNNQAKIKSNLIKLLNKKSKNIFFQTKTFSSIDYSILNYRNHLLVDGVIITSKKIYKYTKYLDGLKFNFFNYGLLFFQMKSNFTLKILKSKTSGVFEIKKKIDNFFQKN